MVFVDPSGTKFELLPLLASDPFVEDSSTVTIQDLIYDLRVNPLATRCMRTGCVAMHPFVITRATCYKEQSTRLGHQHTYVLLKVQPHPSWPQPSWSHAFIKVSQEHNRNPLLTHLGLYRATRSTVTIVDSPAVHDKVVHSELSWPPEHAPILFKVMRLILRTEFFVERGRFDSCHIFAAAVMNSIYEVFGDIPESLKSHPFVKDRHSFNMKCAGRIANKACQDYELIESESVWLDSLE